MDASIALLDRGDHVHLHLETQATPWGTRECVIGDDQKPTVYVGERR